MKHCPLLLSKVAIPWGGLVSCWPWLCRLLLTGPRDPLWTGPSQELCRHLALWAPSRCSTSPLVHTVVIPYVSVIWLVVVWSARSAPWSRVPVSKTGHVPDVLRACGEGGMQARPHSPQRSYSASVACALLPSCASVWVGTATPTLPLMFCELWRAHASWWSWFGTLLLRY